MTDPRDVLVVAEDLTKVFFSPFLRRRVEALRGVSFTVRKGSVTGFLGANGAGKTTTMKVLLGLLAPTSGRASLFGVPVPNRKARERIGFMPESPSFPPNQSAREVVAFAATIQGSKFVGRQTEKALTRSGLEVAAWDRPTASLSKGQGQRVGLAAAIVEEPELLILDEPMSGLDPIGRAEVRSLIASEHQKGCTVLFSTHVLSDAEDLCTHVCMIDQGRVVVDSPLEALLAGDHRGIRVHYASGPDDLFPNDEALDDGLLAAVVAGRRVREVIREKKCLQDVFTHYASHPVHS